MVSTLFPDSETMDPDVWAAREFVRELSGDQSAELVPGWRGSNFCCIAVSLALATGEGDLEYDALRSDPETYADGQGGSSHLFNVTDERVIWPGESIDLGDLSPTQAAALDADCWVEIGRYRYTWPNDCAEWVQRGDPVPDDAWGPGAGTVVRFIHRYDAGEFPSLQIKPPDAFDGEAI